MSDEDYFRHVVGFERRPEKNYLFPKSKQQHDQENASLRMEISRLEEEVKLLRAENLRLKGYDKPLKAKKPLKARRVRPGGPRGRRSRRIRDQGTLVGRGFADLPDGPGLR